MGAADWIVCGIVVAVAVANVVTMRRLWANSTFERQQKVAQSILIWLVPGTAVIVWHLLGDSPIGYPRDATAHSDGEGYESEVASIHHGANTFDTVDGGGDAGGGSGDAGGGGGD